MVFTLSLLHKLCVGRRSPVRKACSWTHAWNESIILLSSWKSFHHQLQLPSCCKFSDNQKRIFQGTIQLWDDWRLDAIELFVMFLRPKLITSPSQSNEKICFSWDIRKLQKNSDFWMTLIQMYTFPTQEDWNQSESPVRTYDCFAKNSLKIS